MENVTNVKTGNAFKGGNLKKLQAAMEDGGFSDPRFGSFNDFKAEGCYVKRGSKAVARLKGQYGTYCVFHVSQTSMPVQVVAALAECQVVADDEAEYQEQPEVTYEQAAEDDADYAAF